MPFDVELEWYCNKNLKRLRKSDEVIVKFVIHNNSLQSIGKVVVIPENSPIEFPRREIDLNLKFGKVAMIDLVGTVSADAGQYLVKFEIIETFWESVICPPVEIKVIITEGLFSSLFKS